MFIWATTTYLVSVVFAAPHYGALPPQEWTFLSKAAAISFFQEQEAHMVEGETLTLSVGVKGFPGPAKVITTLHGHKLKPHPY
jgi:hypothetical protein